MNTNLTEVISLIKSEISVNAEGKATFTIRATARICDVSMQTLSKQFAQNLGDNQSPSKLAQTLINKGFNSDNLKSFATNGIPDLAVATIADARILRSPQNESAPRSRILCFRCRSLLY